MQSIGVVMGSVASLCLIVSIYYTNWKQDLGMGWKWLGVGVLMLLVAFLIT